MTTHTDFPQSARTLLPEEFRSLPQHPHLSAEALEVAASLQHDTISRKVLDGSTRLYDALVVVGSGFAAFVISQGALVPDTNTLFALAAAPLMALVLFQIADLYQPTIMRRGLEQVMRAAVSWALVFAGLFALALLVVPADKIPVDLLSKWFVIGLAGLIAGRVVLRLLVGRWMREGRLNRRAVLIGGGNAAAELIAELERHAHNDIDICGIFDDRNNDRSPPSVAGYPKLGTVSDLVEFARIAHIDMLLVTIPMRAEQRILELMRKLWVLPVDIRLSAHADKLQFRNRASSFVGTVPFVDVAQKPITDWDTILKRIFDLTFAVIALLCLSPIMIVTAIAIRLDSPGPILFRQKRYGFNNELIEVFKFRSMYTDQTDTNASKLVTKNDSRVTKIGRFIRKTSIDELPQLFNVLSGSLSLVGPRPHALSAQADNKLYEQVVDGYFARHKVKPGVTGWAQINGWRGETDTAEKIQKRVEHDIYYIENWSVLFDLYILFRTPISLLNTENAY
ncbi:undecaprenyl-phosphate glucose phosphotransferase [Pseudovibrio sp. SPO723]|uniref:undecaprenyl-phosphate glucose phosphotransferase n=1 Tax=Nesiotobacter zosterae TaxID=392721 RepID=UPI0029C169F2|nr:undecaprenyl-phosphate glucose phosphotransferase [Pseudovibrio sp. SPO723]MDX5592606.1 undecaprenyl-phosphate glucose phosphotransferase [Pseudovibrio sp. SPO723]